MNIKKTKNAITVEFTTDEIKILANDLINPLDHFEQVAIQKLANCKDRLIREWTAQLIADKSVENIPTDDGLLLETIFAHPKYKSRLERDEGLEIAA